LSNADVALARRWWRDVTQRADAATAAEGS